MKLPENEHPLNRFFTFDIRPYMSIVRFEGGESILREGERPAYLFYMTEGRAKTFLTQQNGRVSLISFPEAPCFIGEMELLGAQKEAKGVTAVTPCTCYAVRTAGCRERLLEDPKFLRELCLSLSRKAVENTRSYSRNQSYPLENRLADFILTTAAGGVYREKHTEASEYLGVTYRHLLYVLADFRKRGLLKKTRQGYEIVDRKGLGALASGLASGQGY